MLKAHALYFALIVSLVVTLLCSSVIFIGYFYRSQTDKSFIRLQLASNVQSGINYLLAQNTTLSLNTPTSIDLFGDGKDSVVMERRSWGAFQLGLSIAKKGRDRIYKSFLFGGETDSYCLYLADQGRPLSLCGRTVLKGDVIGPKAGLKRDRIEGQYFVGDKLVWGTIKESNPSLPKLNDEVLADVLEKLNLMNGQLEEWPDSLDKFIHSFFEPLKVVEIPETFFGGFVKGNIVLVSAKPIFITGSATINDIIIVAPGIIFKAGFKGNLQAFATDSIIVENNVQLRYPSVLGVVKSERSVQQPFIEMMGGSKVMGAIFSHAIKKDRFKTRISLAKQSELLGKVYADGYLEAKGTIHGSAACQSILLVTPSSVYENYLLNTTIDQFSLPESYISPLLTTSDYSKQIVKWLY